MTDLAEPLPTEQECLRYGFTQEEWAEHLKLCWKVLTRRVHRHRPTMSYRELVTQMMLERGHGTPIDMGHPGQWEGLLAMIDWVSVQSWLRCGVLIGARVTSGDAAPNWRIFDLAVRFGEMHPEDRDDDEGRMVWWFAELDRIADRRRQLMTEAHFL